MGRSVNAPFLRARPLHFDKVGPARVAQPAAEPANDDMHHEDQADALATRRRKTSFLRRVRMRRPPAG